MAKIDPLDSIVSAYNAVAKINSNSQKIEAAFSKTLSRDGSGPNEMEAPLDMNHFPITNAGEPQGPTDLVRLQDIINFIEAPSGWATLLAGVAGSSLVGHISPGTGAVARTVQDKLRDSVHVRDFGAVGDGDTDDAPAFQRAHDYLASLPFGGTVRADNPENCWKWRTGITWDPNKVGFSGGGSRIDFTKVDAPLSWPDDSVAITLTQSSVDVSARGGMNITHPFEGFVFFGPNVPWAGGSNGVVLFDFYDSDPSVPCLSQIVIKNCAIHNFNICAKYRAGAFHIIWDGVEITALAGGGIDTVIEIPSALNAGERNVFLNCRFGTATGAYLDQANGNASTFFSNCSFNYALGRMMTVTGGTVNISGCHIEGNNDLDWWFHVSNEDAQIVFSDSSILIAGAKTAKAVIYNSSDTGGIVMSGCAFHTNDTYSLPVVEGAGLARISGGLKVYKFGPAPYIADSLNRLAYGDFESANFTTECTLSGSVVPDRSTTQKQSGTYSLRFQGTNGNTRAAQWRVACRPGERGSAKMWTMVTDYGVGGNFYGNCYYADSAGNILNSSGQELFNLTANSSGAQRMSSQTMAAPPGTAYFVVDVSFFNVTSGSPIGYLDNIAINVV